MEKIFGGRYLKPEQLLGLFSELGEQRSRGGEGSRVGANPISSPPQLQEALVWAMRNQLWGHALFLSSKMDPRTYSWVLTG